MSDDLMDAVTASNIYNEPKVSIIILNAFNYQDVISCLKSLKNIEYSNYETILVDYKTPNISQHINFDLPNFKLISLTGNDVGPSAMHNIGMQYMDQLSKYVVFLDSDIVVDRNWLKELVNVISSDPKIGAVQSKLLLFDTPDTLNSSGNKANFLAVGWPDGFGRKDIDPINLKEISFPSGASAIYKKEVFDIIGSFDEDFFIYADDLDIGLRTKLAGYKIMYCGSSIVYHKYRFLRSKRSFYYLNRNRLQVYYKLYSYKTYVLLFPAALVYELFVFGYALLNNYVKELLCAYIYNLKNIKYIYIKRFFIKKYKTISDKTLINELESAITFSIIDNWVVKYLLNPFLLSIKKIALKLL